MKSDDSARSGRARRSFRTVRRYSSAVWRRFIAASTRSEPLCTGRCRNGISSGHLAMRGDQRVIDIARMRGRVAQPGEAGDRGERADQLAQPPLAALSGSGAVIGVDVLPSSVISRAPSATSRLASAITASAGREYSAPRV